MGKERRTTDAPEEIADIQVGTDQLATALGIEPSDAAGRLRHPEQWSIAELSRTARALDVKTSSVLAWLLARR